MLVAAPTGAGKTVVGEFAVDRALRSGGKCFYTTPIKALSNQKYAELSARYGAAPGGPADRRHRPQRRCADRRHDDRSAAQHALRRLARPAASATSSWTRCTTSADRFRGGVWEEVILALPEPVRLVSLSATVSNAEEFGEWLETVRGDTAVIVEEHRPVPLWQSMLVGRRLYDLFRLDRGTAAARC